jgi:hypothetical protein
VPSEARVEVVYGLPVLHEPDPVKAAETWRMSRPAFQTIPGDAKTRTERSRQSQVPTPRAPKRKTRPPLLGPEVWPNEYRRIVAEMRRERVLESWENVATRVRLLAHAGNPGLADVTADTVSDWCDRDDLPPPSALQLPRVTPPGGARRDMPDRSG